MLKLSRELGKYYSVFYNGPKCGASAPDHMHFQAGSKFFMPIENDYENFITLNFNEIYSNNDIAVRSVNGYLRNIILIESPDKENIINAFNKFYSAFDELTGNSEEPLMNVISVNEKGSWRVIIIPRANHRPDYFFADGDNKILLSPASVDLGGVCITPLEKDYEKITKDQIADIYEQVCLPKNKFDKLINMFSDYLTMD
jgi:hypothetical protein